jgi:hypothetical protein
MANIFRHFVTFNVPMQRDTIADRLGAVCEVVERAFPGEKLCFASSYKEPGIDIPVKDRRKYLAQRGRTKLHWFQLHNGKAATCTFLGFPDEAQHAALMPHSYRTPADAWLVRLTAEPLDTRRSEHIDVLATAYRSLPRIGMRLPQRQPCQPDRPLTAIAGALAFLPLVLNARVLAPPWARSGDATLECMLQQACAMPLPTKPRLIEPRELPRSTTKAPSVREPMNLPSLRTSAERR